MRLSSTVAQACVVALLCAGQAFAAGPELTPGKWIFESTTVMSMTGTPETDTETRCITAEEAERDPLAAMVEEDRCKVLSRTTTGNSTAFEIECEGDPKMNLKMRGKGVFTANGTTASGKMDLSIDMPSMPNTPQQMGRKMAITMPRPGTRLGACD